MGGGAMDLSDIASDEGLAEIRKVDNGWSVRQTLEEVGEGRVRCWSVEVL